MIHPWLLFTIVAMNFSAHGRQNDKRIVTKVNFTEGLKLIFVIVAHVWFAYFSFLAFLQFQEEKTGLNQVLTPVTELPLPWITICSQEIFHDVTNETTADIMLQNLHDYIFTKKDLLGETFFEDSPRWNYHEIFSYQLGLCFTLRTDKLYDGRNYFKLFLKLPLDRKYQV